MTPYSLVEVSLCHRNLLPHLTWRRKKYIVNLGLYQTTRRHIMAGSLKRPKHIADIMWAAAQVEVHPVIDTQSEDCHSGTELLCRRSKVVSKRRFCSAVLCISGVLGSAHHIFRSAHHSPPIRVPMGAIDAQGSADTLLSGTVLTL